MCIVYRLFYLFTDLKKLLKYQRNNCSKFYIKIDKNPEANISGIINSDWHDVSFITLTKLAQFLSPIPVFKSVLNFLSASVVSFSIVFSFDLHMMQNSFTFGKILHKIFWKNTFEWKFLYWSNSTFFSSNQAKSGTIRKIIARRLIKWCWTLFSVKIGARYGGWKLTGHLIWALL